MEKLSEIPLVKKALTHNGQKCKLVINNFDWFKPAAYMYDKKPFSNTMFVCSNFFEESTKELSISDGNLKLSEHIEKINTGDKFQDKNSLIDEYVSNRLLYGVNQPMEIKKVIFALNIITHEVGHAVGFYTAEIFSKDKDSWDKFLKLVEITGIQPKSKEKNVEKTYDKIKEQLKSCIEGKMNIRILQNFIKTWLIGSDPALFISRRATDNKDEYLAELFVHLCGFNLPISQHAKRYADILKVIHGEDCLGPTVEYQ